MTHTPSTGQQKPVDGESVPMAEDATLDEPVPMAEAAMPEEVVLVRDQAVIDRMKAVARRIGLTTGTRTVGPDDFKIDLKAPEAPKNPVVDALARETVGHIRALNDPHIALLRDLPGSIVEFDTLSPAVRKLAIRTSILHFPVQVLQQMHLLDLDAESVALLRGRLGISEDEMRTLFRVGNPLALLSKSGAHLGVDPATIDAIRRWYAQNDPYLLIQHGEHMSSGPEDLSGAIDTMSFDAMTRNMAWSAEHGMHHRDPNMNESLSLRALTPAQRVALSQFQTRVRDTFERAHTAEGRPLKDMLPALGNTAPVPSDKWQPGWASQSLRHAGKPVKEQDLTQDLEATAMQFDVPPDIVAGYRKIIRRMTRNDAAIRKMVKQCERGSDGTFVERKMFTLISGKQPVGKIEYVQTPFCLLLRCHDLRDYAELYHRPGMRKSTEALTEKAIQEAGRSGGFSTSQIQVGTEAYSVNLIVENAGGKPFTQDRIDVFRHEEMHAYHDFFLSMNMHARHPGWNHLSWTGIDRTTWLRQCMQLNREVWAETRGKEEVLCGLLEGRTLEQLRNRLLDRTDTALYDYARQFRENVDPSVRFMKGSLAAMADEEMERPYVAALDAGLQAVSRFQGAGWNPRALCELLITEPMAYWPRLADDMLGKAVPHPERPTFDARDSGVNTAA